MNKIIRKYTFLFLSGVVAILLISVSQIPKLSINPEFENYIPGDVGNRAHLNTLDSIFGGNEKIIIILESDSCILNQESFDRIQQLVDNIQGLEGIERTMSLYDVIDIKLDNEGFTTLDPLIDGIPPDPESLAELRQTLRNSEMGRRFISSDFTSTAIILTKSESIEDKVIIPVLQEIIDENPGKEKVHLGGMAYVRQAVKSHIKKDMVTLLPAALLLMILMLYFFFREWKGVLLPLLVVVLSIIFSFGLMSVMGWEISLVSVLLPIILVAVANDYGIHLINLYQEKINAGRLTSMKEIAVDIYRELRKPILITALTTIGGMLGLLSHEMAPAAQLGVLASFGIGLAFLMSLYLIPVLLTFYKKPESLVTYKPGQAPLINKVLCLFARWVNFSPKMIVASFFAISLLSISGIFLLKVDTNVEGYFAGKSEVKEGIDVVNQKFGGSQYVSVHFNGEVLSSGALSRMDNYTREIKELPGVGHIISPGTFFKELSKGLYTPDEPGYLSIPQTEAEAAQYLEIAGMGGFSEQASQIIDPNHENARILVSLKDGSNQTGKATLEGLRNITSNDPQLHSIAGPGLSKIQIAEMVIKGQITSLLLAFIIIFALLSIIFKAGAAGVKGSLPLLVAILFLFGLMGFGGIPLDIVTALLSSIMIGVGIDYTIHFLWRFKTEYAAGGDIRTAISSTMITTGKGIIFNAFSVMAGFAVLIFSGFAPLRFFGVLVFVSILSCLVSALLLVPAIVVLTRPKFLQPKKPNGV
ncbi:MAG: MMPL family transporter [Marinilabilia sp.]